MVTSSSPLENILDVDRMRLIRFPVVVRPIVGQEMRHGRVALFGLLAFRYGGGGNAYYVGGCAVKGWEGGEGEEG